MPANASLQGQVLQWIFFLPSLHLGRELLRASGAAAGGGVSEHWVHILTVLSKFRACPCFEDSGSFLKALNVIQASRCFKSSPQDDLLPHWSAMSLKLTSANTHTQTAFAFKFSFPLTKKTKGKFILMPDYTKQLPYLAQLCCKEVFLLFVFTEKTSLWSFLQARVLQPPSNSPLLLYSWMPEPTKAALSLQSSTGQG